jgi:hypothetical protein
VPVIPTIQEAEMKKIMVPDQPRPKKRKIVRYPLNGKRLGMVVHTCQPSDGRKLKREDSWSRQKVRPYLQNNKSKKGLRYGSSSKAAA